MGEQDVAAYVKKMEEYIAEVKKKASKEDAVENLKKIGILEADGKTVSDFYSK